MANTPLILSDNLYDDTVLHPQAVVSSSLPEMAGSELYHVSDNLRDLTRFSPSGPGNLFVVLDAGGAALANTIILDRGHNLAGQAVQVQHAAVSDFTAAVTPVDAVIPAAAGGLPSDPNGCLTPDGVWWKTFADASDRYWRLSVPAIAGVTPLLTGLYLGSAYRMPSYLDAPAAYDYRTRYQVGKNAMSVGGVRVKRRVLNFSEVDLSVTLEDADYPFLDAEVRRLLAFGAPWWFCLDDSTQHGAGLMRLYQVPGDTTYDPQVDPVHRSVRLLLEEVIPTLTI
ncbi:MAG TPA: hypothetical protein VFW98_08320 [Gemmatimonadaceae bacterium]|nr:hypothetical protein [Gemmatimonadaceae bacterium]